MSSTEDYCLYVTAAWDEVIGQGGFRTLTVETNPFVQRVAYGAWRFKQKERVRIRVQLIDRTRSIDLLELHPEVVNFTSFPSLRKTDSSDRQSSPFAAKCDEKLRFGLNLEEEPIVTTPMSTVYKAIGDPWFPLKNHGKFDFAVGLRVVRKNSNEWRVFRTDPEMNVEPSQRHARD